MPFRGKSFNSGRVPPSLTGRFFRFFAPLFSATAFIIGFSALLLPPFSVTPLPPPLHPPPMSFKSLGVGPAAAATSSLVFFPNFFLFTRPESSSPAAAVPFFRPEEWGTVAVCETSLLFFFHPIFFFFFLEFLRRATVQYPLRLPLVRCFPSSGLFIFFPNPIPKMSRSIPADG